MTKPTFRIRNAFKPLVVVITLLALALVSVVVAQPSAIETAPPVAGHERPIFGDRSLQRGEALTQAGVDVGRPIGRDGVEAAQLGKDGGAEPDGGIAAMNVQQSQDAQKTDQQGSGPSGDKVAHFDSWAFFGAMIPIWMFIADAIMTGTGRAESGTP